MNPIAASIAEATARQDRTRPLPRLVSLDAYRGFAMLLMAAELLQFPEVARHFPESRVWQTLAFHWEHVDWTGCSLHDLIQPSFSFMVGVSLPFSIAARQRRGDPGWKMWLHALWRSLLLVLLGVFLRSIGRPMTYWTFEDTLSQIGLGYPFLFALGWVATGWRWAALAVILVGYWAAFAIYPVPPAGFDYAHFHGHAWFDGFRAHWNQNGNVAWAFDRWFLNLFPREKEFLGNGGGYSTLSFIPTLGTMVLGLIAGGWLLKTRDPAAPPADTASPAPEPVVEPVEAVEPTPFSTLAPSESPVRWPSRPASGWTVVLWLGLAGLLCLVAGWALDVSGACPSVKKIWTPAWTLFSGGWCFCIMAAFFVVADLAKARWLVFPLTVVGMNSIAIYVLVHTIADFLGDALHTHFGRAPFQRWGLPLEPAVHGAAVLALLWLILLWMHRKRLYLRL